MIYGKTWGAGSFGLTIFAAAILSTQPASAQGIFGSDPEGVKQTERLIEKAEDLVKETTSARQQIEKTLDTYNAIYAKDNEAAQQSYKNVEGEMTKSEEKRDEARKKLDETTSAKFQQTLGELGYAFQFVTLAGFHALNHGMFTLAKDYSSRGMTSYPALQHPELRAEAQAHAAARPHRPRPGTTVAPRCCRRRRPFCWRSRRVRSCSRCSWASSWGASSLVTSTSSAGSCCRPSDPSSTR